MAFLQSSYHQLVDLFKSMTPGGRLTAGLLLAAIIASLGWLFRLSGPAEADELLFGGEAFSAKELDAMEAAFAKASLGAWSRDRSRMRVPRSSRSLYIAALADAGALPAHFDTHLDDAVASASPFESKDERQARLRVAKQKRLSQIVSQMEGIEIASVTYDEQEKPGFPRRTEKTASVSVWTHHKARLSEERVRTIRDTVAAAIAGLPSESVTVTDQYAGVAHTGEGPDGLSSASNDPYAARKRRYEEEWREKIARALSMVPGLTVEVNVELDSELVRQQEVVKVDPTTVAVASRDTSRTVSTSNMRPGGRPGAVPNAVQSNSSAAVSVNDRAQSQEEQTESEQKSMASHTRTVGQKASFVPKRVSASIAVPESYYLAVWNRKQAAAEGQPPAAPQEADLQKIRDETKRTIEEAVVALFPKTQPGEDIYPQVRVNSFPDLPVLAAPPPSAAETAKGWLAANWETLAMVLLACAGLLFVRALVRQASPPPTPAAAQALAAPAKAPEDEEEDDELSPRIRRFQENSNLRDELAELVQGDPDAAATVLRNWIGEVS